MNERTKEGRKETRYRVAMNTTVREAYKLPKHSRIRILHLH
jgi:hypothetical protein